MRILLNFSPNVGHKGGRFSKILLKKGLEFVLSKKDNTIAFNLGLVLLLIEVNLILEEQSHKKNTLGACSTDCVEIVLTLWKKVIILPMRATIV